MCRKSSCTIIQNLFGVWGKIIIIKRSSGSGGGGDCGDRHHRRRLDGERNVGKEEDEEEEKEENWATKAMVVQVLKKNGKGTGRGEQVEK